MGGGVICECGRYDWIGSYRIVDLLIKNTSTYCNKNYTKEEVWDNKKGFNDHTEQNATAKQSRQRDP